jgi:hypothetical protein
MPFIRLLTGKPILFDVYVSTYGTMVDDRLQAEADSLKARVFWLADHLAMRAANHLILESNHHIETYRQTYRISADKFTRAFLPSDDSVMRPREPRPADARFRVHFHGEYAPFHGVDVILRAAKLLEAHGVDFQIIGTGITYERDRKLASELRLTNVEFIDRVPYSELAVYMSRADACLGFFGGNKRADRSSPGETRPCRSCSKTASRCCWSSPTRRRRWRTPCCASRAIPSFAASWATTPWPRFARTARKRSSPRS